MYVEKCVPNKVDGVVAGHDDRLAGWEEGESASDLSLHHQYHKEQLVENPPQGLDTGEMTLTAAATDHRQAPQFLLGVLRTCFWSPCLGEQSIWRPQKAISERVISWVTSLCRNNRSVTRLRHIRADQKLLSSPSISEAKLSHTRLKVHQLNENLDTRTRR